MENSKQYSLRALRGSREMTREQAAQKIGVSVSTLSRWEKGQTFPNIKEIKKICEVYDCLPSSIFFKI